MFLSRLAPSTGFEPAAHGVGGRCSIHLSYEGRYETYYNRFAPKSKDQVSAFFLTPHSYRRSSQTMSGIVASERIVVMNTVRFAKALSPPYSAQRIGAMDADGIAATTVRIPSSRLSFTKPRRRRNVTTGAIRSLIAHIA